MPTGFSIEIIGNLKKIKENSRIWTAGQPGILPKFPKFFENLRKFPKILGWAGSGLRFPRFPEPSWLLAGSGHHFEILVLWPLVATTAKKSLGRDITAILAAPLQKIHPKILIFYCGSAPPT